MAFCKKYSLLMETSLFQDNVEMWTIGACTRKKSQSFSNLDTLDLMFFAIAF